MHKAVFRKTASCSFAKISGQVKSDIGTHIMPPESAVVSLSMCSFITSKTRIRSDLSIVRNPLSRRMKHFTLHINWPANAMHANWVIGWHPYRNTTDAPHQGPYADSAEYPCQRATGEEAVLMPGKIFGGCPVTDPERNRNPRRPLAWRPIGAFRRGRPRGFARCTHTPANRSTSGATPRIAFRKMTGVRFKLCANAVGSASEPATCRLPGLPAAAETG